jgi:hypothetical protein
MFKRNRFAAVMAIVVAIVVANPADARPGGSFRSGFSSARSAPTRSVATPKQPSFGSFGQRQSQPPAAARAPQRDSAMSRDLDRKAAQDQAMRTYDARTSASTTAATGGGLPPLNPVLPGGGNGGAYNGGGAYAQHSVPGSGSTSAPAPVIVRESNNHWLWGIGGFMLGRATGSHAAPAPVIVQNAPTPAVQQADVSGSSGAMADAAGANDIATAGASPVQAATAKPAAHQTSALAKLAVALLIGGLVWLAWKAFRLMATAQEVKKNANYSFERN